MVRVCVNADGTARTNPVSSKKSGDFDLSEERVMEIL
jgi:hypothetical protein